MGSLQHVQLPNGMLKTKTLVPRDLWIYICIKSFMNSGTRECFPSLKTLQKITGYSIPIIRKSISLLEKENWLIVKKFGRQQKYFFKDYKNFEPFSFEFIKKTDLDVKEKSYIVASQQFMFKDTPGFGKISYTDKKLSEILNIPEATLISLEKSLQEKGYLSVIPESHYKSGIHINNKFFKLDELGQNIVFALQNHEERLLEVEETLSDEIKNLKQLIAKMGKSNQWLTQKLLEQKDDNTDIIL